MAHGYQLAVACAFAGNGDRESSVTTFPRSVWHAASLCARKTMGYPGLERCWLRDLWRLPSADRSPRTQYDLGHLHQSPGKEGERFSAIVSCTWPGSRCATMGLHRSGAAHKNTRSARSPCARWLSDSKDRRGQMVMSSSVPARRSSSQASFLHDRCLRREKNGIWPHLFPSCGSKGRRLATGMRMRGGMKTVRRFLRFSRSSNPGIVHSSIPHLFYWSIFV
jgi:hypothetical protein